MINYSSYLSFSEEFEEETFKYKKSTSFVCGEEMVYVNEKRRYDITGAPCSALAVKGETWHIERFQDRIFLVESFVE